MAQRPKRRRRTRTVVLSAFAMTLLAQIGFSFFLPWWHPDTEYRLRKELIQSRISEHGNAPIFVMVGSSRVVSGFNPEDLLHLTSPSGQPVLSFNFGHVEAGPVCNLLQVKRLLRCGIKPDWLIVEVAPMYCAAERNLFVHNLSWEDIGTIAPYHSYRKFAGSFLRNHFLLPWYRHRGDLQQRYWGEHPDWPVQCNLSAYGWGGALEVVEEQQRRDWTERARQMFGPILSDQFEISSHTMQAYRDLLALCRTEKIEVALVLMPEGNTFRSWYSPRAEHRLQSFCHDLEDEFRVPVIDARAWLDDSFFADSHHLGREGARCFSRRLERDILQPWIQGNQLWASVKSLKRPRRRDLRRIGVRSGGPYRLLRSV